MRRFLDRLTPSVYQELLGADTKQKERGLLSTKLVRFIRTVPILTAAVTVCGSQLCGQLLDPRTPLGVAARAAAARASVGQNTLIDTWLSNKSQYTVFPVVSPPSPHEHAMACAVRPAN
jgi:hypothetical protein